MSLRCPDIERVLIGGYVGDGLILTRRDAAEGDGEEVMLKEAVALRQAC